MLKYDKLNVPLKAANISRTFQINRFVITTSFDIGPIQLKKGSLINLKPNRQLTFILH
jgi:hypothetical protein